MEITTVDRTVTAHLATDTDEVVQEDKVTATIAWGEVEQETEEIGGNGPMTTMVAWPEMETGLTTMDHGTAIRDGATEVQGAIISQAGVTTEEDSEAVISSKALADLKEEKAFQTDQHLITKVN